jgi:hypothetical protein
MLGEPLFEAITCQWVSLSLQFHGVKAINVTGDDASALADLGLHRSDLRFALESLEAMNYPGLSEHIQQSLWRSAIVHYFKCFQQSKARSSLKVEDVYDGTPPEAMINYDHFRNIRNKTLVHDENSYTQVTVAAILNDGNGPNKIEGIRVLVASFGTLDQSQYSNFHVQVKRATEWVERQFNTLELKIRQSLEAMPYQQLCSMPAPTVRVPTVDEVSKTRARNP